MSQEREDLLLLVMIVLLLLLSAVIWIAFCIAVKRTAMKFLELKRQRRREYFMNRTALPSYEEALSMSCTPNNSSVLEDSQGTAPSRPDSRRAPMRPPSYDSATGPYSTLRSPEMGPSTGNESSLFTLS